MISAEETMKPLPEDRGGLSEELSLQLGIRADFAPLFPFLTGLL